MKRETLKCKNCGAYDSDSSTCRRTAIGGLTWYSVDKNDWCCQFFLSEEAAANTRKVTDNDTSKEE